MTTFKFSPRWQQLQALISTEPDRFFATLEDRERQIEAYLEYGEETYTPVITGSGGNPNLGSTGGIFGAFTTQGLQCRFWGNLEWSGAGTTNGAGGYLITLPFRCKTYTGSGPTLGGSAGPVNTLGAARIYTSATNQYTMCNIELYAPTSDTQFYLVYHGGIQWAAGAPWNPAGTTSNARWEGTFTIDE